MRGEGVDPHLVRAVVVTHLVIAHTSVRHNIFLVYCTGTMISKCLMNRLIEPVRISALFERHDASHGIYVKLPNLNSYLQL